MLKIGIENKRVHSVFLNHKSLPVVSTDIVKQLKSVCADNHTEWIVVHDICIDHLSILSKTTIPLNRATIISNNCSLNSSLGYVEDSPFINISTSVRYPTWVKSGEFVLLHASLVNLVGKSLPEGEFTYWLNSLSKLTMPQGVNSYQLAGNPSRDEFTDDMLYRFVKQHYKRRWSFFLLFCNLYYDRKFPVLAFAKAQFFKKRELSIDINSLRDFDKIHPQNRFDYDVVIPTIGRAKYLKDILVDLNNQAITPKRVIIVEQITTERVVSELEYLLKSHWNFEIIHKVTTIVGACRARNMAANLSLAEWVLLFDDDIRIKSSFSSQVLEFINKTRVKCVTFSCLQQGEIEQNKTYKQWNTFGSGCSIVHREIVDNCYFDLALEHGYGEDMDYGMQVRNAGYDIIYTPHIKILHLKAPIGGFRTPFIFPWEKELVKPKPSPQIMYHRIKNTTKEQLMGYRLILLFKFYKKQSIINPLSYYRHFKKAWESSVKWSKKLPINE